VFDVDASELENLPRKTTVDLYGIRLNPPGVHDTVAVMRGNIRRC